MVQSYISIDLETTGLNPKTDRIIEIGALKIINGQCEGTFSTFVNPGRKLEQRIVELTGICDEDLESAPSIEQVLPTLIDFLGDLPLLGHSILFDFSFLKKAAVNQKISFEKQGIDTLKIARKYLSELEHRSLDYLCEYYQIAHHAHRALEDAKATDLLYRRLAKEFYTAEESPFCPLQLQFKVKRDTPATKSQKERLYRLVKLHKLTLEIEIESMTRSEASRYTDKILAKYS